MLHDAPTPSPGAEDRVPGRISEPGIKYYPDMEQGSDEWKAIRCGLLTASEMKLIMCPPPKPETRVKKNGEPYKQREQTPAENAALRAHVYKLAAQRLTGHVPEHYISDDMLRGKEDEIEARIIYDKTYGAVSTVGFVTNDWLGFPIGYSPDGLVGDDGLIECKSRRQEFQFETIVENVTEGTIPAEFLLQVQTGLLVTRRKWCDLVSYSGGLPMATMRVLPDPEIQEKIVEASVAFEDRVVEKLGKYHDALWSGARLIPTERKVMLEMHI